MGTLSLQNTLPTLLHLPRVNGYTETMLTPGVNHIDEGYWQACKQNGSVKRWIEVGYVTENGAVHVAAAAPASDEVTHEVSNDPTSLKVNDAVALIARETEMDKLTAWLELDSRKGVQHAIQSRLAELAEQYAADLGTSIP